MDIPKKLQDEIWDYCRVNKIPNVDDFINKMVGTGFNIEKYGNSPFGSEVTEPEIIEKEVEVIKEVPVEVIKEVPVEVIKEVIKEVEKIVEKEVYKTDDEVVNKLTKRITQLEGEVEIEKGRCTSISDRLYETTKESGDRGRKIQQLEDEIKRISKELEEEKKSYGIIERERVSEIERLEGVIESLQNTHDELCDELGEVRRELDEKVDVVVDEKYKGFWEDEISAHDKTKEEIKKLKDIITHLKGGSEDNNDIYDDTNRGWWGGGSNIRRKK